MRALIDPVPSELVFLDLFRVSHFMPPPYKIQDLATPNNLFFFGGGICNERGTGRSKWLWSCNHKNIGTFFHYNRSMGGILERVWLIKRGFIFCFLVSFIMGLGQLSLLLTWSFIEITILIIIPLLRFNHLHNSLVLKYFLVQSIGSITLLTRLIFLFRLFDQKSLFLFLIVWKVALVFIFILPPDRFRESPTGVSVTCLSILKMSVKKNISNTLFLGQEYSDFQKRLYKLSIRILETDASVPPTLTLIAQVFYANV